MRRQRGHLSEAMREADSGTITALLREVESGNRDAIDSLFPLVYEELRVLAHRQRRRWDGNLTLNTTALVHEAYLKLADQKQVTARGRTHFFAIAAKAIRQILCNHARDQRRQKRGGGAPHISLHEAESAAGPLAFSDEQSETLALLDESLQRLERTAKRQSQVVECRFFGGLSIEDTAAALGISPATAKRDWQLARAWLYRDMQVKLGTLD